MACLSAIIGPLVAGEPNATELPAMMGVEKIAVTGAQMVGAAGAGAAPQYHLVTHELAVVFAHGPLGGLEARVGQVGAGGPFPDIAEQLRRAPLSAPATPGWKRRLSTKPEDDPETTGSRAAACSHSASVGRRLPLQRAKASAS